MLPAPPTERPALLERLCPTPSRALLAVALATGWLCFTTPVFSQEAYYWTYAQNPDLSYFDHPPMVAWLIWLGTQVLGDGSLGLRLGTWLCGLGTTWFGLQLARDFGLSVRGQIAWVLGGLVSPILTMTHFVANPDAPLVVCWTLVMWSLWRARGGGVGWWLLAGVAAGAGLLGKYSAAFLAFSGVALLLLDPPLRRQLLRPWPWLAVVVAGCVFAPVVLWNMQHDYASFRFQTSSRFAKASLSERWVVELLGTQVLIVHPLLAALLPATVWWLLRRARQDVRTLWLLAFALPLPCYMVFQSLWIHVKMNWLAPAYVPLVLGMVMWWQEERQGRALVPRWLGASLLMVPSLLVLMPLLFLMPTTEGTSWTGWGDLARAGERWLHELDGRDGKVGNVFVFSADYRDSAQLGRARKLLREDPTFVPHPAPTLAQNVWGRPGLQYDYWVQPATLIGQDAVYVLPRPGSDDKRRNDKIEHMQRVFERSERVEHVVVDRLGIRVMDGEIWLCYGYRGPING